MIRLLLTLFMLSGTYTEELSDFTVLYPYTDFISTTTFRHIVPASSLGSKWHFQVENKHPEQCDNLNVTIVIQHGSLPVINPLGENIPDNFFLANNTGSRHTFTVLSNNMSREFVFYNPKPGPWYTVAYLPKSDGKLRPADLFVKCVYRLRNWFSAETFHIQNLGNELRDLKTGVDNEVSWPEHGRALFRFFVPLQVYEYKLSVTNCNHDIDQSCDLVISTRGQGLPGPKKTTVTSDCPVSRKPCEVEVFRPSAGDWNYLEVTAKRFSLNGTIFIDMKECKMKGQNYGVDQSPCVISPLLDKYTYNTKFHSKFVHLNSSHVEDVIVSVTENQSQAIPVRLEDGVDNGGSMVVQAKIKSSLEIQESKLNLQLDICLMKDVVPKSVDILLCSHGYHGNVTTLDGKGESSFKVVVPYPQAGYWFVGLMLRCNKTVETDTGVLEYQSCGKVSVDINVTVTLDACVEGGCSDHGRCINYLNGHVLFTTCRCDDGWQGFDCSDGSELETDQDQLLELLLLTLSNLVFLPAIFIAMYRRHYVEALFYFYNMFFSAFYHACDGGRREGFTFCPLPIHVLSTCDFLSSASSIWITLVAMSRPPLQWKAFIQFLGPLGILVGVLYRKTSAFLFLIPAGTGFLLLLISWVCRCCYRHKCYPNKLKYVLCLLPGWLLAAGGLAIFTFLENEENYLYTHSAWHACMALSVCLLLPPRDSRVYKVKKNDGAALGSTYQPIRTTEGSNYVI